MDGIDKKFLCVKEIKYVGPAVNPFGANAARIVLLGRDKTGDFKPVSYTHDFPY